MYCRGLQPGILIGGAPFRTTPKFRQATPRIYGCRSLRFPEGCGFRLSPRAFRPRAHKTFPSILALIQRYPSPRNFFSLLIISLAVAFAAPTSVLRPSRVNSKSSVPFPSNTFVTDAEAPAAPYGVKPPVPYAT